MGLRRRLSGTALWLVLAIAAQPSAQGGPPPQGRGATPQGGRGGRQATFPAQQRPPGDPAVIARGNGIGNPSNASQTYLVDGRQYVLVAVGDALYAFVLN